MFEKGATKVNKFVKVFGENPRTLPQQENTNKEEEKK